MSACSSLLQARLLDLARRYVRQLRIQGSKATGLAPCHDDTSPSFTADLEKCCWYCHACNIGGGVKDFALLVGEPWPSSALTRQEKRRVAVSIRQRKAEQKARAILQQREEERLDGIFAEWREVNQDAAQAAALLALFNRRPDLEEEFSDLAAQAEREYGAAIHRRVYLEARMGGEVEP